MREIKFRVWVKTVRKMYELQGIDLTTSKGNYGYIIEWDAYGTIYESVNKEDAILMQFTGLTDKNGKDIYEGDIVKWEYEDAVGWHKIKRLVTWVAEDAYFDIPVKRRWTRNIEVIGNMYEHPKLVEVR